MSREAFDMNVHKLMHFRAPFAVIAMLLLQGCVIQFPSLFGGESRGPVTLETIEPAKRVWTRGQILILDLVGDVSVGGGGGGLFGGGGPGMLVALKDRLDEAENNGRLRAVIVRLDTPGGGVTASDLIHREIVEFKQRTGLPVIAFMQGIAASGGVYIAMAADEIWALPSTLTGSIGVITILPRLSELGEKIGIGVTVIKSGEMKDAGSPWRELTESDRAIYQGMVDSMYGRFVDVIINSRGNRGLTREKLAEFADGRILEGAQAADLGLIDGVKYLDEVIERAKQLAGVEDAAIVSYEYPFAYRGNIYAFSPSPRPRTSLMQLNLLNLDLGFGGAGSPQARFLYRWMP